MDSPDELSLDYNPLQTALTRPDYEPDSQTIIVDTDWVRGVQSEVIGPHYMAIILQFCTWHGVKAIKQRLIAKGYSKEKRAEIVDLIWK